ncbi:zinc transporter ZupT [Mariniphaga sediminis]|jgi:ZIP family zinc transporter|uniref:Zinc transporter ZupT n=1 Tax=Mariniphaga sediminis TaxID=1628158 RepID=A0A399CWV8_9BACT|nr:zinc transporter ZupT [Mariniphaga sediminis]RIH63468.1 zinc transporter ZupT [Mariniphaga sediminis]
MTTSNVLYALLLTAFAGLSTGIGSTIALMARKTNTKLLTVSLGFSAGVMIYISFVEIFFDAKESFVAGYGEFTGTLFTILAFFGGILLIGLIDRFIPSFENPHEMRAVEEMTDQKRKKSNHKLYRTGILTAVVVAFHNFPEGIATFISALNDPTVGIAIAIAVAIHNIPEGIAVSVPIFYATGSRRKAFLYSFLSGLAEPVGAILAYFLLLPFLTAANSEVFFASSLAFIAGIMVFISLDELLPSAEEYGEHHWGIYGLVGGMAVMAVSLLFLN